MVQTGPGGYVVTVERATSDTTTLWAATQTGRVFLSNNADADPVTAVVFTRLDSLAANDPNRFVSGIHIDPSNPNRAWLSYSGFDATTPTTPGHVFQVTAGCRRNAAQGASGQLKLYPTMLAAAAARPACPLDF